MPAFLGEAHFNAQSYSLDYVRTPERRELDYVRQTAASVETAKEVKIFGLNGFLIDRYRQSCDRVLRGQSQARAAARRLGRAVHRDRHHRLLPGLRLHRVAHAGGRILGRRPDFPCGLVPAPAQPSRRACWRVFRARRARRSISTTCSRFSRSRPEILSPENPLPFPAADPRGLRIRERRIQLSRRRAMGGAPSELHTARRRSRSRWSARTAPARRRW